MSEPEHEAARVERVERLLEVGRFTLALREAELGLVDSPDSLPLMYGKGFALLALDRHAEAESVCAAMTAAAPDDAAGFMLHSQVRNVVGDKRGALSLARTAARLAPDVSEVLQRLGEAQVLAGKRHDAVLTARALERLEPGTVEVHELNGLAAIHGRRPALAEHHFRKAIALEPMDPRLLVFLALVLERRGKPLEAIDTLHRAVRLAPTEAFALDQLHDAVERWLPADLPMFHRRRRRALERLAPAVRAFHHERRARRSPAQRRRAAVLYGVVMAGMVGVAALFVGGLLTGVIARALPSPEPETVVETYRAGERAPARPAASAFETRVGVAPGAAPRRADP